MYVSPQIGLGVDDSQMATCVGHSITPPLHAKIERKKPPTFWGASPAPLADSKLGVWTCCSRPNFECPGVGAGFFALPGLKTGHHVWRHVHGVTTVDAPRRRLHRTRARRGSSTLSTTTPVRSVVLYAMAPHLTGHELGKGGDGHGGRGGR